LSLLMTLVLERREWASLAQIGLLHVISKSLSKHHPAECALENPSKMAPQIEQEAKQQMTSPQREIQATEPATLPTRHDKICMMTTRLACNWAIESSYWRMDNNLDVGLLTGYVLYWLPIELGSMDLDTFSHWFGLHPSLHTSW
jgi:hypothetical protein